MPNTQSICKTTNQDIFSFPPWMEPYLELVSNINPIIELMKVPSMGINLINSPLVISVSSQIALLYRLHEKGII